uniref:Protein RIC1 homolog n=1 Tax=Steinernema glaseri TaxID=37863 RepID=A0A1I7ZIN4_9BILA
MFLPEGGEIRIDLDKYESETRSERAPKVVSVVGNREKNLLAVLTESSIYIFLANPQIVLCCFRRSAEDVSEKGTFKTIFWRGDSSALAVSTSHNVLFIYRVVISDNQCFNLIDANDDELTRKSQELFIRAKRPVVDVSLAVIARLDSTASCLAPLKDEILVCLQDGWMHRISWEGVVDSEFSFHLSNIPFTYDQLQSKPEFVRSLAYVRDIEYAPLVGGFVLVLSDGRAALLTSQDSRFHPQELLAVWAIGLNDACCCTPNHKYRLIMFGCLNGEITGYHLDESNGSLMKSYRVALNVKDGSELLQTVGTVRHISYLNQGSALAAVWNQKERDRSVLAKSVSTLGSPPILAIFSPFGSLLWSSLESNDSTLSFSDSYTSVEWGPEGYHLWLGSENGLSLMRIVRSISVDRPNMEQIDSIIMLGSEQVFFSPPRENEQAANAPHSVWNTFNIPSEYLATNWPVKLASVENTNPRTLVVAGQTGFCFCNIHTGKWRLFGNETQERNFLITGGITLWNEQIVAVGYDAESAREEIRLYPISKQLDNQFAVRHVVEYRVLAINTRNDYMLSFDLTGHLSIYRFLFENDEQRMDRLAEIVITDLIPHPSCVVSMHLTSFNHDCQSALFCEGVDTVLVNVSGHLIMLQQKSQSEAEASQGEPLQLSQPMLVASCVEQIWHYCDENTVQKPHLSQALWIKSGAKGMKVWMPLFPKSSTDSSNRSFIAKRIMLPFDLDINPLVISSNGCLAFGVESFPCYLTGYASGVGDSTTAPPVIHNLSRNSKVFLHHLLRQLLKRNLGLYALEIAGTCRNLSYFKHVLELLLHNVLEEEATSSEPIPDSLLPRVVAFIHEFPEFLEIVAHCARKTELALWHALFAVLNHPRELFDVCIREGQLDTAASYLIVLQNMETGTASRHHSGVLLEEALNRRQWIVARDIVRFLRAIDPADIESPPKTPLCPKGASQQKRSALIKNSAGSLENQDGFVVTNFGPPAPVGRTRVVSFGENGPFVGNVYRSNSTGAAPNISPKDANDTAHSDAGSQKMIGEYLHDILESHARTLLTEYALRDLGAFSAHLDFSLHDWLGRERRALFEISNFPLALMKLHTQFQWPYPLLCQSVVNQIAKRIDRLRMEDQPSPDTVSMCSVSDDIQSSLTTPLRDITGDNNFVTCIENNADSDEPSDTISNADSDWQGFERICGESTARGGEESESELVFMLDIFHMAGYLEWTYLICVMLRDVGRLANFLSFDVLRKSAKTLSRLRSANMELVKWAESSCVGYKALFLAFDRYLSYICERRSLVSSASVEADLSTISADTCGSREHNGTLPQSMSEASLATTEFNRARRHHMQIPFGGEKTDVVSAMSPSDEGSDCSIM